MEMKQINKVSIALKPNVYSTFRNLNNTVSNTLGEYVDNAVQSFFDTKSISCKINLAHPFFTRFEHFKKGQDYAPIVAIFKALTLAEIMAPDKGTKFASNLRILFNQNILQ